MFLFRKPLEEKTIAKNVLKYGTGGINIDATRVAHSSPADFAKHKAMVDRLREKGGSLGKSWKNTSDLSGANEVTDMGRWPTNMVLVHSSRCRKVNDITWECGEGCPAPLMDLSSGIRKGMSGGGKHKSGYKGGMFGGIDSTSTARGDTGGAARFLPQLHGVQSLFDWIHKLITPVGGECFVDVP